LPSHTPHRCGFHTRCSNSSPLHATHNNHAHRTATRFTPHSISAPRSMPAPAVAIACITPPSPHRSPWLLQSALRPQADWSNSAQPASTLVLLDHRGQTDGSPLLSEDPASSSAHPPGAHQGTISIRIRGDCGPLLPTAWSSACRCTFAAMLPTVKPGRRLSRQNSGVGSTGHAVRGTSRHCNWHEFVAPHRVPAPVNAEHRGSFGNLECQDGAGWRP
jgi:hypothetical protein